MFHLNNTEYNVLTLCISESFKNRMQTSYSTASERVGVVEKIEILLFLAPPLANQRICTTIMLPNSIHCSSIIRDRRECTLCVSIHTREVIEKCNETTEHHATKRLCCAYCECLDRVVCAFFVCAF